MRRAAELAKFARRQAASPKAAAARAWNALTADDARRGRSSLSPSSTAAEAAAEARRKESSHSELQSHSHSHSHSQSQSQSQPHQSRQRSSSTSNHPVLSLVAASGGVSWDVRSWMRSHASAALTAWWGP